MNPITQKRFRKDLHQLLSGNYANTVSRWCQMAHDFKHQRDLLLGLIEEVMIERADLPLEINLADREKYEAYFEILKAWIIYDNHDLAISYFNQLIEDAHRINQLGQPITEIQALAMNNRAYMHHLGQGEKNNQPNHSAAIPLYDRAGAAGNTSAMTNRAYMYQCGEGEANDQPDYPAAITLYDRAGAAGEATAMNNRAVMHRDGQGDNEKDVRTLIGLMWDDLLENKPLTPQTQELLSKRPHLITEKLLTISNFRVLREAVKEGCVICELLSHRVFRTLFQSESELSKVKKYISFLERSRLAEEHNHSDIELDELELKL